MQRLLHATLLVRSMPFAVSVLVRNNWMHADFQRQESITLKRDLGKLGQALQDTASTAHAAKMRESHALTAAEQVIAHDAKQCMQHLYCRGRGYAQPWHLVPLS
jgi:hypothetical protein